MASFSIQVEKHNQRKDGTYPIAIKVRWQSETKGHIPTNLYATKKQVVESKEGALKLTDSFLLKMIANRIALYKQIVIDMGLSINSYTGKDLAKYIIRTANELTAPETAKDAERLSLTDFASDYTTKQLELNKRKGLNTDGSAGNIRITINSLHRFAKRDNLLFDDISVDFLDDYCHWMLTTQGRNGKGVKGRGLQLNLMHLKQLFKLAERKYNKKRERTILIFSPFDDYTLPTVKSPKKRAITLAQMRAIMNYAAKPGSRAELAHDMAMLSFYLIGMNSVDLYTCPAPSGDWLTYNRSKTRHTREDAAEFSLKIPPEALPILEKYTDKERLLNVHKRYSDIGTFNAAINKGLKQIGHAIATTVPELAADMESLTFYAIRHTWATFAENNVGLSTSLVGRCLNHVDEHLKVTKGYIKTDWRPINKANRQVIDFLIEGVEVQDD